MDKIKRVKPYCYVNKHDYKFIWGQTIENVGQLDTAGTMKNITEIMQLFPYIDFAEELEIKDEITRRVYAKGYYGDINIGGRKTHLCNEVRSK